MKWCALSHPLFGVFRQFSGASARLRPFVYSAYRNRLTYGGGTRGKIGNERTLSELHITDHRMPSEDLPLLPAIPERLRIAAGQGILVPFVGAGVSQLAGCPGWDDFADTALSFFVEKRKLDHAEYAQLRTLSPRVKMSVAVGLEKQHGIDIDFRSILQVANAQKRRTGETVYRHLWALAKIFVTTNYDEWLDDLVPPPSRVVEGSVNPAVEAAPSRKNVLFAPEDFTATPLSTPNTVIHIHGSIRDRASMVLTTSDYLERYASHRIRDGGEFQENRFLVFLEHLFFSKSVIFIGYSLGELEVLEYVIQKARGVASRGRRDQPREEPQHFLLQGFFSHEAALVNSFRDYYLRECNIRLLPFSKDQKGWEQLIDVIEYLSTEIPVGAPLRSQLREEMAGLLNDKADK